MYKKVNVQYQTVTSVLKSAGGVIEGKWRNDPHVAWLIKSQEMKKSVAEAQFMPSWLLFFVMAPQ